MTDLEKKVLFRYMKEIDKYEKMKKVISCFVFMINKTQYEPYKVSINDILTTNADTSTLQYVLGVSDTNVKEYLEFKRKFLEFNNF